MKLYKCAHCGQECGGNNDADKEAELYWGVKGASKQTFMTVVCDHCWENVLHPLDHLDKFKEARERLNKKGDPK